MDKIICVGSDDVSKREPEMVPQKHNWGKPMQSLKWIHVMKIN